MADEQELRLYGEIGPTNMGMISDIAVIAALDDLAGARRISIRLNSPGGDAFMGISIMNALKRHKAKITIHVDALAASAASIIAMGGDKLVMHEGAMLMIHRAWTIAMGNSADLLGVSEALAKIDDNLRDIYHRKSGIDKAEIMQMIDAETWLTAAEAVNIGLADETDAMVDAKAALPVGWYVRAPETITRYSESTRPAAFIGISATASTIALRERWRRTKRSLTNTLTKDTRMYTAKKLREQIAELSARCDAIVETGELNDALREELDSIQGTGQEGHEGFVPGKLHTLKADLERMEAIDRRTAEKLVAASKLAQQATPIQQSNEKETSDEEKALVSKTPFARCETIKIPVHQQFRHRSLRAFSGPQADRQAYLAGMFFLGTIGQGMPAFRDEKVTTWCKDHGIDLTFKNAMGGDQNNLGGVLVPDELERSIITLREERGVARREALVVGMGSDTMLVPRRTGGLSAYFVGQNPSSGITESDSTFDNIELIARTLATLTRYSIQLSDDAVISIGDYLATEIAYAFADKEDECCFNGSGTSTYGGIVGLKSGTAAGSKYTALAGNTGFSTLDLADFESMVGQLPKFAEANAKWYIHKAGWAASMLRLIDAGGGNTYRDLSDGRREMMFLGYPVVHVQVMNSTLTAQVSTDGLCYFGDLRQAVTLGNRRGISVFPSEHRYMEYNQIGIRGMQRFDLNYHERGTASVAGSVIMLSTPGA